MQHGLVLSTARIGVALALLVVACSGAKSEDPDSSGTAGSGGAATPGAGGVATGGTGGTTSGGSTAAAGTASFSGGATSTGGATSGTGGIASATGGATATGGAASGSGGTTSGAGAAGFAGSGGGAGGEAGTAAGATNGGAGAGGAGGLASGGAAGTAGSGGAAAGTSGSGGTGGVTPPTGANSIAYIGCSMAWNIGNGYKRVGGEVMWNSDSYQTSAMVVQNWTNPNSSSWNLFDQKMTSIGGKDTVKAIMIQICIFSSRATDAELRSVISAARQHVNPDTHIYIVGQPQYQAGHECTLAGNGGAKWTDDQAQALAADPSINENLSYLGAFKLDSTKGEVSSDSCHATTSGENVLGEQAKAFFGG